jgi:hypothetical protein
MVGEIAPGPEDRAGPKKVAADATRMVLQARRIRGGGQVSERHGYQPGVPCWVATVHSDAEAAVGFYTELFGWAAENLLPPGSPGKYFMCKLRGRDVAALVRSRRR